ncbi:MAG: hypothetical protein ACTSRC_19275 [Candidatus Helarchaeota archaeon]
MIVYGTLMEITGAALTISEAGGIVGNLVTAAGIILSFVSLIQVFSALIQKQVIEEKATQQYLYGC